MKVISLTLAIAILPIFATGDEFPICAVTGDQSAPDVAFVGNEYIVVYDSLGDIWAARVDLQGNVSERLFIHTPVIPGFRDTLPAVATDGERWFVVWTAWSGAAEEELFLGIWGAIYEGSTVIKAPFIIDTWATSFPDISCNGDIFLICGTFTLLSIPQYSFLKGRLYDRDGNPLLTDISIDMAGGPDTLDDGYLGYPTISSDGDTFIVVYPWCQYFSHGDTTQHAIKYKFVTSGGSVEDGGVLFSDITSYYSVAGHFPKLYSISPDIAFNGINYFCSYHVLENYQVLPGDGSYNVLGAVINQAGEIVLNEIPIAVVEDISEFASGVTAEYENFFVVWQDSSAGNYNIYGRHYSQDGNSILDELVITEAPQDQTLPSVAFDDLNILVVWQDFRNYNWDIWANLLHKGWTDDPLALAYNGNRHLVRKPNSQELHLIYTDHYYDGHRKIIYQCSSNGGTDWSLPEIIGNGKYPAIALSSDYLPSVTWTDDDGGLWYRRQIQSGQWSDIYHLYNPGVVGALRLNSPPSVVIISSQGVIDMVHTLVTRSGGIPNGGPKHTVEDYSFPITQPGWGRFYLIEQVYGALEPPLRSFPSITECDVDNSLHAVWQRSDTICYATKPLNQRWSNWGWQFFSYGLQSAHPFVESYGDSIFVMWQRKEGPSGYEEIYRAYRHLSGTFDWDNFSLTPLTRSLYPVNANGFFTVFVDLPNPYMNTWYEIYCKTHPAEPSHNISQTPYIWSHYPHSAAKFSDVDGRYLYTAWLEWPGAYTIEFKRIHYIPTLDMAYLTSPNGHNPSSPYLVDRDSFISEWQIPVDIGYETITYQFPLKPSYLYKLKAIAYHECIDKWKIKLTVDNEEVAEIEYEAYKPETLELWISPEFYVDSIIEVAFERDDGNFAAVGPVYIYQYECDESIGGAGGGPMGRQSHFVNSPSISVFPNPFKERLNIRYQATDRNRINLKLYDVAGRLVKQINYLNNKQSNQVFWDGVDENGRAVTQGIYFLQIEDVDSGGTSVHKVLKVR